MNFYFFRADRRPGLPVCRGHPAPPRADHAQGLGQLRHHEPAPPFCQDLLPAQTSQEHVSSDDNHLTKTGSASGARAQAFARTAHLLLHPPELRHGRAARAAAATTAAAGATADPGDPSTQQGDDKQRWRGGRNPKIRLGCRRDEDFHQGQRLDEVNYYYLFNILFITASVSCRR